MELIASMLAPLIVTAIVALRQWLQARVTPERLSTVNQLARVAVEAAEEIGRATNAKPGDKFTYAENFLRQAARRVGVKLTNEEVNAFIHAVLNGRNEDLEMRVDEMVNAILATYLDGQVPSLGEVEDAAAATEVDTGTEAA